MTIIVPLTALEEALHEHIRGAEFDRLADIAGKVFGGECCYWGGKDEEFRFYPDDNYTGDLNNFEENKPREPLEWTNEDSREANKQGWNIFQSDALGAREIERVDEMEIFKSDSDAVAFVTEQASKGSELARRALLIHWTEWKLCQSL